MGWWMIPVFAKSLLLTLLLEEIFAGVWHVSRKDLCLVFLVNVLTNPPVVFVYYMAVWNSWYPLWLITLLLEGLAVMTEALYYKKYAERIKYPLLFSLAANLLSYSAGKLAVFLLW